MGLFNYFFSFFKTNMFLLLTFTSLIASIHCKPPLAKGPLEAKPSLKQPIISDLTKPEPECRCTKRENNVECYPEGCDISISKPDVQTLPEHVFPEYARLSWCPSDYDYLPCSNKGYRYGCSDWGRCWRSCHFGRQWCWMRDRTSWWVNCKRHADCVRHHYTPYCASGCIVG